MKKIFLYAMIAFVSIALMSCNKDKNNVDDPTTENPYAYLRLSDITPLHMISLAKAEEKLRQAKEKEAAKQAAKEAKKNTPI